VTASGVASEAVDLIDLHPPDVVVTDLHMPKHDGVWLLEQIKSRMPDVPVILVSGYIDDRQLGQLRALGFADVLAKPLPVAELANTVARGVGC
jgi:CheY-like chemotaxis protein